MNWKQLILTITFGLMITSSPISASEDQVSISLEGKKFTGKLKVAKGFFRFVKVNEVLIFKDGTFAWKSGISDGYEPVPYQIKEENGVISFTAISSRIEGDSVEWVGIYDGTSIHDVKAVWTRVEKDPVHDLLLPSQVNFEFRPIADKEKT